VDAVGWNLVSLEGAGSLSIAQPWKPFDGFSLSLSTTVVFYHGTIRHATMQSMDQNLGKGMLR
jgi:hypothetical protein